MRHLLFALFLSLAFNSYGQDTIEQKMDWLVKAKSTNNFFVHFDKNVYTNNEIVYFTAYLIKEEIIKVNNHKLVSVCLIRDLDSTIIIQDKFMMSKGLSFGSITIPDSLLTGNYHFLAYTDQLINGLPSVVFTQSITIKTNIDPAFRVSLKILENTKQVNNEHQVLLAATTKDNRFLPKPIQINYKYGKLSKTAKTDPSGQLLITLPMQNDLIDPNLYVKLKSEKDSSYLSLALPVIKSKATVNFYPEGGNLVRSLSSNVGWEVKDQQKMPVAVKAFLFEDKQIIDTIETNSYGIGKFSITPVAGVTYSIRLIHSGLADSVYYLPKALEKGFVLGLKNAVAKDTLSLIIKTTGTKNLTFLVHNFRKVFLNVPFDMGTSKRAIKIPLEEVPKGLMTLTVLDSLNRPLAERMFFANYSNDEKIIASTDKQIYNQREKVTLKLKLNADTIALASIACIQDNRLEAKKNNDIESFTYLTNELNTLPVVLKGTAYKDVNYLEGILLVKGWRKYTWQDLQTVTANDTITKKDSLQMLGWITKSKKELMKPVTLAAFGDNKIRLINTSNNGHFNFNTDELILEQGRKSLLFINDKNKFDYRFQINDQFLKMNEKLTKFMVPVNPVLPSTIVNNAELVLKGNEKAIRLKEVVIKSRKDNSINYRGAPGANACGDYVCRYNILNCRNHPGDADNTQPVAGRQYMSNGVSIIYQECKMAAVEDETFLAFNGIHQPKEFYLSDYKDPQEPAFFSTIYWNYGIVLTNKKEAEINFFTSDITGRFRIVVQGISNKDVVYAEHFFEVNSKK